MKAQFRILDGTEVVNQYEMEYSSAEELNDMFHVSRQVWGEYMVEVETEWGVMSHSHTYAEVVRRGWA